MKRTFFAVLFCFILGCTGTEDEAVQDMINDEVMKPMEPMEPVEPVESVDPVDPVVDPVELVEPVESVDPVELVESVEPVEPRTPPGSGEGTPPPVVPTPVYLTQHQTEGQPPPSRQQQSSSCTDPQVGGRIKASYGGYSCFSDKNDINNYCGRVHSTSYTKATRVDLNGNAVYILEADGLEPNCQIAFELNDPKGQRQGQLGDYFHNQYYTGKWGTGRLIGTAETLSMTLIPGENFQCDGDYQYTVRIRQDGSLLPSGVQTLRHNDFYTTCRSGSSRCGNENRPFRWLPLNEEVRGGRGLTTHGQHGRQVEIRDTGGQNVQSGSQGQGAP